MSNQQASNENDIDYGPLAGLIGVWEGNSGIDVSPGVPDRLMTESETHYRER